MTVLMTRWLQIQDAIARPLVREGGQDMIYDAAR